MLGYAIEMVKSCLRAPADVECGGDMGTSPVEDLLNLGPVFHVLVLHGFDGCTRYDHAIKLLL